jgi:D-3-phosphoglycerate dehydrogenase / 2-oxoglutarate reductase
MPVRPSRHARRPFDVKPRILRTDAELFIIEQYLDELHAIADVATTDRTDEDGLAAAARDATLILTCYTNVTAKVIESARKLKGIVKYGVGTDNIDIAAATRRGVMVANCPDYGTDTVADHAFALLIALARKIPVLDRAMRAHGWAWPAPEYFGVDLAGKTIGIVGFGRIGRAMARRAQGFGMARLVTDPYVDPATVSEFGVRFVGLDELLARSDFVSVHCVLTPETKGLIGEAELAKMKPTAFLIDVSRGAIVDDGALARALDGNGIAGAAFDVFAHEPLAPGYPLLGRDNVILTPHLAWYTEEAFQRCERDTLAAVRDMLAGKTPKNLKNADAVA